MSSRANKKFDKYSDNYEDVLNNSLKFLGEESSFFSEYKVNYIKKIFGKDFNGRILDFGCGIGALSRGLNKSMPLSSVHGYDVSSKSINKARELSASEIKYFSDESSIGTDYDLITVVNVFHHIPISLREEIFFKLKSFLSDTGRLLIIEHNPINPLTRLVVNRCEFDDDVKLLSFRETKRLSKKAGLSLFHADYILFFPKKLNHFHFLEHYISWFPLGAQYAQTWSLNEGR